MDLRLCILHVISSVLLLITIIGVVHCEESDEQEILNIHQGNTKMRLNQSAMYRFYLEWIAEKLKKGEPLNSGEFQLYSGLMEKRDRGDRMPALEAYFIYKVNRNKCINLGDEGCINGSIPGSGSDSGYLNGGNNPGK